ncbi:cytochrome P450 CYP94D108 [Typha latifolia]|uniref:cytochrome P450 CYP94D108 n=1 Tax=Typha latifolia TaxID=4733 RepID=UPI003C305265
MELFLLQSLFFLLLLLPLLLYLFFHQDAAKTPITHGLKSYPILGYLPHYIRNRHRFLEWSTEILICSPTHTMGFKTAALVGGVITANPLNVEHMLKTNFGNYPKGKLSISMLEDFLGHGIFNSDGEQWRRQRKAASFEFNKRSLRNFVVETVQFEIVERLLPLLRSAQEKDEIVDLQGVLERFGFDNICNVAFGEDPGCLTSGDADMKFMKAFGEAQNLVMDRFMSPIKVAWRIKKILNIGSERRLRELFSVIHNYSAKIIRAREQKAIKHKNDLLSRFAFNGEHNEESLRDVVTNFILAGRETTSSALTWFFWIISTRPDVADKIVQEVKSIRASNQDSSVTTFSYEDLGEMHYLHAAISESLRLYPPVAMDTQSCGGDDTMPDGTFVGKGWFVSYSAYAMARVEAIWGKDCNEYKPERWLEDGVFKPVSPFRYPVFHAGPRMCLGKEMAYIQMKSIVACVLERFKISVVGKEGTPEHILSLTLRMKGGLPVKVMKTEE